MSRQIKNLLLTFDYEPYLGIKSGTAEDCLLTPTILLNQILERYQLKAIFFVDTLYLLKLGEHEAHRKDYGLIVKQIKDLHQQGHYIFPHIHPHWTDATYVPESRQFSLSNLKRFSLASLEIHEAEKLFEQSITFLKRNGIQHQTFGYRAGGWCIQPFDRYIDIFRKYNIKHDFSVLPGYKNESEIQHFDFSNSLTEKPYSFSTDVLVPKSDGEFTEFPISAIKLSRSAKIADRIVKKYLWKTNDRGFGNGIGAQTSALKANDPFCEMISIDILTIAKLQAYKKYIKSNDYMHWISHPKMFTKHGLSVFEQFIKFVAIKYDSETDYMKMIS